jgi:hypothetical protein
MKFAYNKDYVPPAPHLEIRLAVPDETFRMAPLAVLIDTGADATIVPLRYIRWPARPAAMATVPWTRRWPSYTSLSCAGHVFATLVCFNGLHHVD